MLNVTFRQGDFKEYRAVTKFHVGHEFLPYVEKDQTIQYDGFEILLGETKKISAPHIRAAIKKGWLVEPHEFGEYTPQSAFSSSPEEDAKYSLKTEENEKVVGSRDAFKNSRKTPARNADSMAKIKGSNLKESAKEDTRPQTDVFGGTIVPVMRLTNPAKAEAIDASKVNVQNLEEKRGKVAVPISRPEPRSNFDLGSVGLYDD